MDYAKEDIIITAFLQSLGPWKSRIVIGGGYAPIIYKLYFTQHKGGTPPVGTRDIDSLIPRKIPEISKQSIKEYLKKAGFEQQFKDRQNPATMTFYKSGEGVEVEVEFLTDDSTRKNKGKNVDSGFGEFADYSSLSNF